MTEITTKEKLQKIERKNILYYLQEIVLTIQKYLNLVKSQVPSYFLITVTIQCLLLDFISRYNIVSII
jgi:hypothetical protein